MSYCEGSLRILVVLVLYRMDLAESSSFQSLLRNFPDNDFEEIHLLIFDNSPVQGRVAGMPAGLSVHYRHDPANGGLSAAYNCALELGNDLGCTWLLLLDQDSELPRSFLAELAASIREFDGDEGLAAIVPQVRGQRSILSPHTIRLGFVKPITAWSRRVESRRMTAINSGTAVRIAFLNEVGGFSRKYWLDFMDYWLFNRIHKSGKRVGLSGSAMEHHMTLDTGTMALPRYVNMLDAEARFVLEELPAMERVLYLLRLWGRVLKQIAIQHDSAMARATACKSAKILRAMFLSQ